jgi:hypothetical protein
MPNRRSRAPRLIPVRAEFPTVIGVLIGSHRKTSRTSPGARALAHALAGDGAAAAEDLAELDALDLPPVRRDEADLLQAGSWAAVAAGDLPGASDLLDEAGQRRGAG